MAYRGKDRSGVTVEIAVGRLGGVALLAVAAAVLALGTGASAGRSEVGARAASVWPPPRLFYLTEGLHDGKRAATACEEGYHMASLWEIRDTSRLIYDTARGYVGGDAGVGPPSAVPGWVRTGYPSLSGALGAGVGNCQAWTSDSSSDYGSVVRLSHTWDAAPTAIAPWVAESPSCDTSKMHVWCVESSWEVARPVVFLPLVLRRF